MTLTYLQPWQFASRWDDIKTVLAPAMVGSTYQEWDVFTGVMGNRLDVFAVSGDVTGYLIGLIAYPKDYNFKAAWAVLAAGEAKGGPHDRAAAMNGVIREFEAVALRCGCKQTRVEGRPAWRRVLTDYDIIGRNGPDTIFAKVLNG